MNKISLSLCSLLFVAAAIAQSNPAVDSVVARRMHLEHQTSRILGVWGLGNVVGGGIGWAKSDGSEKYFYQMNLAWGAFNTGFALLINQLGKRQQSTGNTIGKALIDQHRVEKILLLNVGLDVAYMSGGWALLERSKGAAENPDRAKGFGNALLLQGGFLLAFDLLQYAAHHKNGKRLNGILQQVALGSTANGVGLQMKF